MCKRIECRTCGKPTWTGCGAHIEQALAGVPVEDRCKCGQKDGRTSDASQQAPAPKKRGLFGLF